jgi:hypothetical protein
VVLVLQYRNTGSKENGELIVEDDSAAKPVRDADLSALIHNTKQELQPELGTQSDEDEEDDPDDWEEYDTDEEANANALFHQEFYQHKKDYYMTKLECDTVDRCMQQMFVH